VRDGGVYGIAAVSYQITQSQHRTTDVAVSSMFVSGATGLVLFDDRQFNAELTVSVLNTGIPHFDLHYTVQLVNVTGMLMLFPSFFFVVIQIHISIKLSIIYFTVTYELWSSV